MITETNKPEILSFSYQEIYLTRELIKDRKHLISFIKMLSKKFKYPVDKIIFNHDLEDNKYRAEFINNFKKNGSYDYLKKELKN